MIEAKNRLQRKVLADIKDKNFFEKELVHSDVKRLGLDVSKREEHKFLVRISYRTQWIPHTMDIRVWITNPRWNTEKFNSLIHEEQVSKTHLEFCGVGYLETFFSEEQ